MAVTEFNTSIKQLEQQVSGKNEKGEHILSVLVKRTFSLNDNGVCTLADVQLPLNEEQQCYANNDNLLEFDSDLFPYKLFTDIVIKGKARNYDNKPQFDCVISLDNQNTAIKVTGNRKPYLNSYNKIAFSETETLPEVPLRYDYAYGGIDFEAEKKQVQPPAELIKALLPYIDSTADSPYRYPRNPCGRGYIVELNSNMVDQLQLPLLEDPEQLLTPETILVKQPKKWFQMPLPRCTDWVHPAWFPRLAYFGICSFPDIPPFALKEVKNKWAEPDVAVAKAFGEGFNMRCANGASLGFQVPVTTYSRQCRLLNIHPKIKDFVFSFPDHFPRIWIDGRNGKLLETKTTIHSITIEPDERRVSVVWRGSEKALRPYLQTELDTMPYKIKWNK